MIGCIRIISISLTSPTARNLPSLLIETQVAALILSRLVQVFLQDISVILLQSRVGYLKLGQSTYELGESPHSRLVCGVDGEYGTAESLTATSVLFLPSLAVFVGVDGAPEVVLTIFSGTAVGRALKNRCKYLEVSSTVTTTAAAPAVYAKVLDDERQSKAVGEETVVPMILLSDKPDS